MGNAHNEAYHSFGVQMVHNTTKAVLLDRLVVLSTINPNSSPSKHHQYWNAQLTAIQGSA